MVGFGLFGVLNTDMTLLEGLGGIGAGLAVGIAALSAVGQGIVSSSSIGASLSDNKATGKGLVLSVIPETYAIFGLLIALLIMIGLKII
jgi:V/A-type H+-transporting ATPase subunit K